MASTSTRGSSASMCRARCTTCHAATLLVALLGAGCGAPAPAPARALPARPEAPATSARVVPASVVGGISGVSFALGGRVLVLCGRRQAYALDARDGALRAMVATAGRCAATEAHVVTGRGIWELARDRIRALPEAARGDGVRRLVASARSPHVGFVRRVDGADVVWTLDARTGEARALESHERVRSLQMVSGRLLVRPRGGPFRVLEVPRGRLVAELPTQDYGLHEDAGLMLYAGRGELGVRRIRDGATLSPLTARGHAGARVVPLIQTSPALIRARVEAAPTDGPDAGAEPAETERPEPERIAWHRATSRLVPTSDSDVYAAPGSARTYRVTQIEGERSNLMRYPDGPTVCEVETDGPDGAARVASFDEGGCDAPAFSADGERGAITNGASLVLFDARTGEAVAEVDTTPALGACALDEDGDPSELGLHIEGSAVGACGELVPEPRQRDLVFATADGRFEVQAWRSRESADYDGYERGDDHWPARLTVHTRAPPGGAPLEVPGLMLRCAMVDDGPEDWTEYVSCEQAVALSPSGRRLAAAGGAGVIVVELPSGVRRELEVSGPVVGLEFAGDEALVVAGRRRSRLINLRGEGEVVSERPFLITADRSLAVGVVAASVLLVDLADFRTHAVARAREAHERWALSRDASTLVQVDSRARMRRIDLARHELLATAAEGELPFGSLSADAAELLRCREGGLERVSLASGAGETVREHIGCHGPVRWAFADRFAWAPTDGGARLIRLADGASLRLAPFIRAHPPGPRGEATLTWVAHTEDGRRFWVPPDARPHFRVRAAGAVLDAPLVTLARAQAPQHDATLLASFLASDGSSSAEPSRGHVRRPRAALDRGVPRARARSGSD